MAKAQPKGRAFVLDRLVFDRLAFGLWSWGFGFLFLGLLFLSFILELCSWVFSSWAFILQQLHPRIVYSTIYDSPFTFLLIANC